MQVLNKAADSHQPELNEDGTPIDRFKKVMPRKLTLVLEMVDILVKIVDVNSEQMFPLSDQSMHQVAVKK